MGLVPVLMLAGYLPTALIICCSSRFDCFWWTAMVSPLLPDHITSRQLGLRGCCPADVTLAIVPDNALFATTLGLDGCPPLPQALHPARPAEYLSIAQTDSHDQATVIQSDV